MQHTITVYTKQTKQPTRHTKYKVYLFKHCNMFLPNCQQSSVHCAVIFGLETSSYQPDCDPQPNYVRCEAFTAVNIHIAHCLVTSPHSESLGFKSPSQDRLFYDFRGFSRSHVENARTLPRTRPPQSPSRPFLFIITIILSLGHAAGSAVG